MIHDFQLIETSAKDDIGIGTSLHPTPHFFRSLRHLL